MATYTGSDKRIAYLFEHGGGGSGGESGGNFTCDLLLENTDFSITSGSATVEKQYTLSASIDGYDTVLVTAFLNVSSNDISQAMSMIVPKTGYYNVINNTRWTYLLNGSIPSNNRRFAFGFSNSTTILTAASRVQYEEPKLYRVYGLRFGSGHTYSTDEQIVGTWIDGKPLYEKTYINLNILINNTTSWFRTGIVIPDINTIVGGSGIDISNQYWSVNVCIYTANNEVGISIATLVGASGGRVIDTLTLRYTKTTD